MEPKDWTIIWLWYHRWITGQNGCQCVDTNVVADDENQSKLIKSISSGFLWRCNHRKHITENPYTYLHVWRCLFQSNLWQPFEQYRTEWQRLHLCFAGTRHTLQTRLSSDVNRSISSSCTDNENGGFWFKIKYPPHHTQILTYSSVIAIGIAAVRLRLVFC